MGQSGFSADILEQALQETQAKIQVSKDRLASLRAELLVSQEQTTTLTKRLDKLTWADLFAYSDREVKKMVICHLIHRIFVFRGYALCLEVNYPVSSTDI